MEDNWKHFEMEVVISDWQFYVWMVVYGLQLAWLIYALIALCRETKAGCLIINPPIMPSSLFFTLLLGLAGTIGWLVLWDMRDYYTWYSAICILGSTMFMTFTVAISLHATNLYQDEVIEQGNAADVWVIRSLVQNCTATYATWAAVETTYTIGLILYQTELVSMERSNYIILAILMLYMVVFMMVDLFWGQQLTCLLLSPYVVFIIAYVQPVVKQYDNKNVTFTLSAVFLGITAVILVSKLILMAGRCFCERKMLLSDPVMEEFGAVQYDEDGSDIIEHSTGTMETDAALGDTLDDMDNLSKY